jgi:hypothetical protein
MIDIEKFVLKGEVESNPLVKIHLKAMKWFGYMIFEQQRVKRLHCFRGVVFTLSFIVFNLTQVRFGIYKKENFLILIFKKKSSPSIQYHPRHVRNTFLSHFYAIHRR